jgi:predicted DNA-binding protein
MKRTNIHLAPDQIERLREAAERKGVSVAELVRRAIEAYLNVEERRKKKR